MKEAREVRQILHATIQDVQKTTAKVPKWSNQTLLLQVFYHNRKHWTSDELCSFSQSELYFGQNKSVILVESVH